MTNPEVVDLQFALQGRSVPLDYADLLWREIRAGLPWLDSEALAGVHPLYGLSPGRGEWYLSRRAHLNLRLPRERVADAQALVGARLELAGIGLEVGKATAKAIAHAPVIHAKFVAIDTGDAGLPDEERFFAACLEELSKLEINPRSVLCGKRQIAQAPHGSLHGFSLMVTGLDETATLRLMKHGLGIERKRGCGIFVPHKFNPANGG